MVMEESEVLMHLRPQTPQEKLLWERESNKNFVEEIKNLKERNAQLEAVLSELRQRMKTEQVGALILKNNRLQNQLNEKNLKIKAYKKEKEQLLLNLIKLQQTGSIGDKESGNSTK